MNKQGKRKLNRKQKQELVQKHISEYERIDYKIILATLFLCAFGLIMIYSASSFRCSINPKYDYDSFYFAKKQLGSALLGITLAIFLGRFFDYQWLRPFAKVIYILAIGSIFLLKTPLGVEAGGAVRWIHIGVSIQVAEVVKIALIILLAGLAYRNSRRTGKLSTLILFWAVGGVATILVFVLSNDLSSGLILAGITFGMTFIITRFKKTHIFIVTLVLIGVSFYAVHLYNNLPSAEELKGVDFRHGRMAAWVAPENYADGVGYQTMQALYAVTYGGFTGQGLGHGVQKLSSIPEAQNDMIFSIVCEELGLVGAAVLLFLFSYLMYQLLRVAVSCKALFGSALVVGILLHLALQILINLSVVLGVIPNTGASLPFISYGGTAILFTLSEIGLVLSVYRKYVEHHIMTLYGPDAFEETETVSSPRRQEIAE